MLRQSRLVRRLIGQSSCSAHLDEMLKQLFDPIALQSREVPCIFSQARSSLVHDSEVPDIPPATSAAPNNGADEDGPAVR